MIRGLITGFNSKYGDNTVVTEILVAQYGADLASHRQKELQDNLVRKLRGENLWPVLMDLARELRRAGKLDSDQIESMLTKRLFRYSALFLSMNGPRW